jgi:rfaE bifunctional protein nucleotidyltransferase chain/domain
VADEEIKGRVSKVGNQKHSKPAAVNAPSPENDGNALAPARAKIGALADLAAVARNHRAAGRRIVLAHGTFDLLHLGHVRYLEESRRQGDVLLVTVTADAFVNKGPGRPVFQDLLRAEMVAALSCVDGVAINHAPTSVNVIEAIKPDVYVKGIEYKDAGKDVTGKIVDERRAVEAHGGRVHFTDDVTFSSSFLINRYVNVSDPELSAYLDGARERQFAARVPELIERIADKRVLLIGETIIDEYDYVSPLGKPSKEPVLATLSRDKDIFAGGVIAAANHAASFCREVEVFTCLGADDQHEERVRAALWPNVKLWAVHRNNAPTTRKTRFVDAAFFRKLFEVYTMDDSPLPPALEQRFVREIAARAKDFDVVIVTDFGHGLLGPAIREAILDNARFLAVNAQSNAANHGFNLVTKYPRADYVCIDAPEARLAVADKNADLGEVASVILPERMNVGRMILTHGINGCVIFDKDKGVSRIPAFTRRVLDTMGAGDAFLAVTAPLASVAEDMELVGFVGNLVGSIKVGILGHRERVDKTLVLKYAQALLK